MRTLDRYVIRQTLWPAGLGLVVFTFLLIVPIVLRTTEELVAKGVSGTTIVHIIVLLLPQALGISIPMALLLGLLMGLGRLSSDREWVAMQACGIGLARLLRPVLLLSSVAFAATLAVFLWALPQANQAYREIIFRIVSERAEGEVKPRVFFDDFPNLTLYVQDVPRSGGWSGVFMADARPGQPQAIYTAARGRVVIDRDRRHVEMVLDAGSRHVAEVDGTYQVSRFERLILSVNPESVFPRAGPAKGEREMSIPELRERIALLQARGDSTVGAHVEIYKKFSIPFACLVLGLIGLTLGASNRRDGRLASFVIGILVIFTYYVLLETASNLARGRFIPPWLSVWLPNLAFGALGLVVFARRLGHVDRSPRWPWTRRAPDRSAHAADPSHEATARRRPGGSLWMRVPIMTLLDRYVIASYVRVFALCLLALVGLFHMATFIDLSDEVLRGDARWAQLLQHLWYATPQALYYVLPMSVLLATLVTIGLLTKNSELIIMRACGISLYRVATPLLLVALLVGGVLVALQERLLGPANYRADALRHVITGRSLETFDVLSRRWVAGTNGDIYNYDFFNPRELVFVGLSAYHFGSGFERLAARTFADRVAYDATTPDQTWRAHQGWTREFQGAHSSYTAFTDAPLRLEPPGYFSTRAPNPDYMDYLELRRYIRRLKASGTDMLKQEVALERKLAFPPVTLIMTLLAIPFAVTTGSRGAMYGIGVGIVLAFGYWGAMSVFGALGAAGLLTPVLAAWAPSLLFATGAAYLVLTART